MSDGIFRKKSLDKITAPDDLTSYIRVANPGVWIILGAIIALIIGVLVWGTVGRLETKVVGAARVSNNYVTNYVKYENYKSVKVGQEMRINGKSCELKYIEPLPIQITEGFDPYIVYTGNFKVGDLAYVLHTEVDSVDGCYASVIVTGSIAPLQFIFN